jgi:hypothetical protein
MIHREGTNVINTKSGTTGIGLGGGGLGVGFGSTKTLGTSQSQLASIVAMPLKKYPGSGKGNLVLVAGFVAYAVTNKLSSSLAMILFLGCILYAGYLYTEVRREYDRLIWPELLQRWKNSFMCTCCGNVQIANVSA